MKKTERLNLLQVFGMVNETLKKVDEEELSKEEGKQKVYAYMNWLNDEKPYEAYKKRMKKILDDAFSGRTSISQAHCSMMMLEQLLKK